MDSSSKQTVFLSYEREQHVTEFAIKLKNDLEQKGLSVWLDLYAAETNDSPGEFLVARGHRYSACQKTKEKALETCRGLIALLTKGYVSSRYCEEEFFVASNQRKRIFPVVYEDGWNTDSDSSSKVMYTLSGIHIEWGMFRPAKDDYVVSLKVLVKNMMMTLTLPLPGDMPTLPQLQILKATNETRIRVVEASASKWKHLAIALGFNGPKIDTIQQGNHFQPEECCLRVFMKWLDGGHDLYTPISWDSLTRCLRNAGLSSLATDLECLLGLRYDSEVEIEETDRPGSATMEDVSEQIEKLTTRFRNLAHRTRQELKENRTQLEDFWDTVTNMPQQIRREHERYLDEKLGCMLNAKNLDEILYRFNLYWSFIDYSLLKYIVDRFGTPQLKKDMSEYVSDLSAFRKHTTLHQMIKSWDCECVEPPAKFSKLTSKIANQNVKECKLEVLEELRRKFCREFSLSKCFMMFRYVIEGSVIVIWMIPSVLVSGLANAIQTNTKSSNFFEENDIVELSVDGDILFPSQRPGYRKEYSEEVITGISLEQIQDEIESNYVSSKNGASFTTHLPSIDEGCKWVLYIRKLTGKVISVTCSENDTIADVKSTIHKAEGIPIPNQCLVMRKRRGSPEPEDRSREGDENESSNGRQDAVEDESQMISTITLEDSCLLTEYGIENGQELILEPVRSQYSHDDSITKIDYVNIRIISGSMLSVPVEKTTSIDELKVKIKELAQLSETTEELNQSDVELRLIYQGEELRGPQTMKKCGIESGATIHLVPMKIKTQVIHIQTLSGQTLHLDYNVADTVADLKERIEETEETPFEEQNLIFLGRALEDDSKRLSEYNINFGDTVHLGYKQREEIAQPQSLPSIVDSEPIFVKTLTGRILYFDDCNVSDTVGSLKLKIQAEDSISPHQQHLVFDGTVLKDDNKPLSHYNINLGDTLNLSYKQTARTMTSRRHHQSTQLTNVFVKGSYGAILNVPVDSSSTVADVKMKIHQLSEEMGLPEEQELYFSGKNLTNDQKLSECSISDGDMLHVRLGMGRGKIREVTVKSFSSASDDITLSMTSSDTFADIKRKIYEKKSIAPDMQRLLYGGREHNDSSSLCESAVPNRSILYLVVRERPKITIKRLSGDDVTLDFNPDSTIAVVKAQIQERTEIPTNTQTLVFDGKFLEQDEKTLNDCRISNGSTLYMYDDGNLESILQIKIPSLQKTVTLEFNPEVTIRDLKDKLFAKDSRITLGNHSLLYNGVNLDEEHTIGYYGIPKEGVLDLLVLDKERASFVGPATEEII